MPGTARDEEAMMMLSMCVSTAVKDMPPTLPLRLLKMWTLRTLLRTTSYLSFTGRAWVLRARGTRPPTIVEAVKGCRAKDVLQNRTQKSSQFVWSTKSQRIFISV